MKTLNELHQDAQKLSDDIHQLRLGTPLTRMEQVAIKLAETHAEAAASIFFTLGNARDPSG